MSAKVDLVCAVFSCVQTMVWMPVLGFFNMCIDLIAYEGCTNIEKSLHWKLTRRKIPCHAGESKLQQQDTKSNIQMTELHPFPHNAHRSLSITF